jgi:hypothetical protein
MKWLNFALKFEKNLDYQVDSLLWKADFIVVSHQKISSIWRGQDPTIPVDSKIIILY